MDIQAEKIELAKLILRTNDIGILNNIRTLFEADADFFNELRREMKEIGLTQEILDDILKD
jgi:hypothetical protein